jgi:hypothetical protein
MTTKTTKICDVCKKEIYAQDSLIFSGKRYYLRILEVKLVEYVPGQPDDYTIVSTGEKKMVHRTVSKEDVCINCFCRIMDSIRDELDSNNGEIKQ